MSWSTNHASSNWKIALQAEPVAEIAILGRAHGLVEARDTLERDAAHGKIGGDENDLLDEKIRPRMKTGLDE